MVTVTNPSLMSTHIVCVPTAERGGELKDRIRLLAVVKDIHEGSEAYPNSYPAVIVTVSPSGSDVAGKV